MNNIPNDGGPAFPGFDSTSGYGCAKRNSAGEWENFTQGMTLRDYFAAKAMQGLLASGHFTYPRGSFNPDGEWVSNDGGPWIEIHPVYDDDGEPTGKQQFIVPEASYMIADAMLKEREGAQ